MDRLKEPIEIVRIDVIFSKI